MVNRHLVFHSTYLLLIPFLLFVLLGCAPADQFSGAAQPANAVANESQAQQPADVEVGADEPYPVNTAAPPRAPEPTKEATLPPYPVNTPLPPTKEPTPSEPQPPTPSLTEMAITPTQEIIDLPPVRDVEPILFTELIRQDPIYAEVARLASLDVQEFPNVLVMPDEYVIVLHSELFNEGKTSDGKTLKQLGEELTLQYGGEFRQSSYSGRSIPYWFAAVMTPQQIIELSKNENVAYFGVNGLDSND